MEIGPAQICVEGKAHEIVGASVHERNEEGGVELLHVDITMMFQLLFDGAFGGLRSERGRGRQCEAEKKRENHSGLLSV